MTSPQPAVPRAASVPSVTAETMREIDRVLVEEVGLPLVAMMENAGYHLATTLLEMVPDAANVTVLAGKGGNGGGGLAAARHLASRGRRVRVHLAHDRASLAPAAATQARILEATDATLHDGPPEDAGDAIVDALVGYSQCGVPRGRVADLAAWASQTDAPTLSLDVPTGLDPDDGTRHTPAVQPEATVTLALPKTGLLEAPAAATGRLLLADIGVPARVYERFDVDSRLFHDGSLVEIDGLRRL